MSELHDAAEIMRLMITPKLCRSTSLGRHRGPLQGLEKKVVIHFFPEQNRSAVQVAAALDLLILRCRSVRHVYGRQFRGLHVVSRIPLTLPAAGLMTNVMSKSQVMPDTVVFAETDERAFVDVMLYSEPTTDADFPRVLAVECTYLLPEWTYCCSLDEVEDGLVSALLQQRADS